MSTQESRLTINDTILEVIYKLSGDSILAAQALAHCLKCSQEADPKENLDGMGFLITLDGNKIYEEDIVTLFRDVCKENPFLMLLLLKARHKLLITSNSLQLFFQKENLERPYFIDWEKMEKDVKELVPDFKVIK